MSRHRRLIDWISVEKPPPRALCRRRRVDPASCSSSDAAVRVDSVFTHASEEAASCHLTTIRQRQLAPGTRAGLLGGAPGSRLLYKRACQSWDKSQCRNYGYETLESDTGIGAQTVVETSLQRQLSE